MGLWTLGSKLNVSNNSNKQESRIIVSFLASQWLPYFKSHRIKPFMGDSVTRILCFRLCHFSLYQINSQLRTDIFVVFIYGLQMIYFSILWQMHEALPYVKSLSTDLIYGVWSNERVRTTSQCLTCLILNEDRKFASSMCAAANYRREGSVCTRWTMANRKWQKHPHNITQLLLLLFEIYSAR